MSALPRDEKQDGWLFQTGMAIFQALGVWWIWPRLQLPMLGREEVWFALAWFLLLAGPAAAQRWLPLRPEGLAEPEEPTLPSRACGQGSFLLALVFLGALVAGGQLGNYKLWLGIIYLLALTLRLAGLTLDLRDRLGGRAEGDPLPLLAAAAISILACLLIIPWVRPELCAIWPPSLKALATPLAASLLWGAISGAAPLAVRLWGSGHRAAWLTYLAVGLGPGPALAVGMLNLWQLSLAFLGLAGLILLRLVTRRPPVPVAGGSQALPLYWLLRALLLLWWGVGVALTLAAAWWQPRAGGLITENLWLRAIGLGAFLVACLGLLAEYSLPLLGRPSLVRNASQRKTLGLIMTALALLASLSPLLGVRTAAAPPPPPMLTEKPRAELLPAPISLNPQNPEVTLPVPTWLTRISRIFVVSLLTSAAEVPQGEAVAQLVATDDQDIPHIYNLRAGVDTAEWALSKRDVAAIARHTAARTAQSWVVYAPTGEAFESRNYYTGLFLGTEVNRLKSLSLRYLYRNPPNRPPVTLDLKRVFLN